MNTTAFIPDAPPSCPYRRSMPLPSGMNPKPYQRLLFCGVVAASRFPSEMSLPSYKENQL